MRILIAAAAFVLASPALAQNLSPFSPPRDWLADPNRGLYQQQLQRDKEEQQRFEKSQRELEADRRRSIPGPLRSQEERSPRTDPAAGKAPPK